jgi:hypothetical protein
MTLMADPRPSVAKWRDAATRNAIGPTGTATAGDPAHKVDPSVLTTELVGAIGGLRSTIDAIALKDTSPNSDGRNNFGKLPRHLQSLLFRMSHVPGLAEPTKLTDEGENFMAQATLASATSLLKTALCQQFGLSVVVQLASV